MSEKHRTFTACPHGYYGFCPAGCFQTDFEKTITDFLSHRTADTEEELMRLLKFEGEVVREMTFELSEKIKEITRIEKRLSEVRRSKRGDIATSV